LYEIGGERARISCCRLLKLLRLNLLYERVLPERASHHQRVPERHPGMVAVPREVAGFYSPIAQGIQPELCSARRRTFVLQVPDNKADLVKLAAPCGFKYRTIFNSGV